jgi:hypothetical protein
MFCRFLMAAALTGCTASAVRGLEPVPATDAVTGKTSPTDVTASDYAPRLDLLALGYGDGRFEVRSPAPGHLLASGKHEERIMNLVLSRDGQRLATCDRGGVIAVSTVQSGELELLPNAPGQDVGLTEPIGLAWDARGARLAIAANGLVRVTDLAAGTSREARIDAGAHAVAFSPDERELVVAGSGLTFLRLPALSLERQIPLPQAPGVAGPPEAADVRYSPDGQSLGVLTMNGVAFVDLASGKLEAAFPQRLSPVGLRYAEDGRILLFGRRSMYMGEPPSHGHRERNPRNDRPAVGRRVSSRWQPDVLGRRDGRGAGVAARLRAESAPLNVRQADHHLHPDRRSPRARHVLTLAHRAGFHEALGHQRRDEGHLAFGSHLGRVLGSAASRPAHPRFAR